MAAMNARPKSGDVARFLDFPEMPEVKVRRLESKLKSKEQVIDTIKEQLEDVRIEKERLRKNYALEQEGFVAQRDFFKERYEALQKLLEQKSS